MSWGGCNNAPLETQYGQAIINQVYNMGVVLIAAAGNGYPTCPTFGASGYFYPASLNNVISVTGVGHLHESSNTAVGYGNRKDIFENYNYNYGLAPGYLSDYTATYNDRVDLSAPTAEIQVAGAATSIYGYNSGTSLSAPMVMGLVGLMFGANSCLFPDEVESILKLTSFKNDLLPLNLPYQGQLGAGRIDAFEAVDMAKDMSLQFGVVEVKNRIIDRWDFNLRTAPYEIKMLNNLVLNNATLNFTARNDVDVLSGDYKPTGAGYVDLKINPINNFCNSPAVISSEMKGSNSIKTDANKLGKLYPNPNNGNFNIDLQIDLKNKINISVYDLQGNLFYEANSIKSNFNINIPELSKGFYLVNVFNDNINETFNFTVR